MTSTPISTHPTVRTRIAVVEDEHTLREDLLEFLGWRGFAAQGFDSAEAFKTVHAQQPFALLLLDIGLPGISGLELAQQLQAQQPVPGIVMLTAFCSDEDRVAGLDLGADAYLVKGASLQVIEATCQSVLRRLSMRPSVLCPESPSATNIVLTSHADEWVIYPTSWQLGTPNGERLKLTHQETLILRRLMQQPGAAVSRAELLADLGKPETLSNLRNLDNGASRLRRKVLAGCARELPLRPSYGQGYTFSGSGRVDLV
jgi:DNA-binding response OmpR family regulator